MRSSVRREMETRHRIQRLMILLGVQQVIRGQGRQLPLQVCAKGSVLHPLRAVELGDRGGERRELGTGLQGRGLFRQPFPKPGHRRNCRELLDARKVLADVLHHLFDQEAAERNAAQALLAVGDRVKDGPLGRRRIEHRRIGIEQRLHLVAQPACERHLDEDDRLVGQGRVEEGVTT